MFQEKEEYIINIIVAAALTARYNNGKQVERTET